MQLTYCGDINTWKQEVGIYRSLGYCVSFSRHFCTRLPQLILSIRTYEMFYISSNFRPYKQNNKKAMTSAKPNFLSSCHKIKVVNES